MVVAMRLMLLTLALFALALTGCKGEDEPSSSDAPDVEKTVKDAGDALKNKADETLDFACATPGCTKTKSGKLGDPPS